MSLDSDLDTYSQIARQGLSLINDHVAFMRWSDHWFKDIPAWSWCGRLTDECSFAWTARDVAIAGGYWDRGVHIVWNHLPNVKDVFGLGDAYYFLNKGTPYLWMIASCIAIEMTIREQSSKERKIE